MRGQHQHASYIIGVQCSASKPRFSFHPLQVLSMESSSASSATVTVHLLVLIHGMWGNPRHLAALKAAITTKYAEPTDQGEELDVIVAQSIKDCATYDGIDWGGERVTEEVRHISRLPDGPGQSHC